jgi:CHASE3 domain sensor protein
MISRRPLVPLLFVLIAIVAALVALGVSLRSSVGSSFAQGQQIRAVRTLLFGAIEAQLNEETGIRGYAATGDPQFLQPYHAARSELPSIFPQLSYHLYALGMPDALAAAQRARQLNQTWLRRVAEPTLHSRNRNLLGTERLGKALVDRFRAETASIEVGLDR